ncbi:phage portal protein [Methylopila sp. 73B]|uniref:phage portal protein n=1 Tax=Methylopila sp. 73B TaxID=1120792 RepID=UPI00038011E3|nr:phage portal protein [Methylopila sp. 73B]
MAIRDLARWIGGLGQPSPRAEGPTYALSDPRVVELLRFGSMTATGFNVSVEKALKNTTMLRAVSIISNSIGMLPVHLIDKETKEKAVGHDLYKVLHRRPNASQSGFDFRAMMQLRALVKRNAYAQIIRSKDLRTGRERVIELRPLDTDRVTTKLNLDWTTSYDYSPPEGGVRRLAARDVFHLRGMSLDGVNGISVVEQAAEAIGLALAAELAAARYFKNGSFVDSALKMPVGKRMSDPARERLMKSLNEKRGAMNAGEYLLLEEGLEFQELGKTARDAQLLEIRKMQIEEIGRATGVPRPLLMVDETSWGSGISALGNFFVQYTLSPWFEAWQQAGERSLLTEQDAEKYEIKFNPAGLLRGTLKEQAEFLSRALGAGGGKGWETPNGVRRSLDLPADPDPESDRISQGSASASIGHNGGPPLEDDESKDDPDEQRSAA